MSTKKNILVYNLNRLYICKGNVIMNQYSEKESAK